MSFRNVVVLLNNYVGKMTENKRLTWKLVFSSIDYATMTHIQHTPQRHAQALIGFTLVSRKPIEWSMCKDFFIATIVTFSFSHSKCCALSI